MINTEIIRRWAGERWGVPWRTVTVRVEPYGQCYGWVQVVLYHSGNVRRGGRLCARQSRRETLAATAALVTKSRPRMKTRFAA